MVRNISHDSLWESIEQYMWESFEKQWPYFWSEDITDLAIYIRQEKIPGLNPQKMIKNDLKDVLNSYLDSNVISVSLLTDKYPELKREIDAYSEIGINITMDWYIGRGRAEFDFYDDTKVMSGNIRDTLMKLGYSSDQLDIMSAFTAVETSEKFERNLLEKQKENFNDKWSGMLRDEIKAADNSLRELVNSRVFEEVPFLIGK
ncbi:hypothetical protein [Bacillus cereus]|uniref:hypothetical protein n=1 Tax=Bacillus cereus TaxID=1396 RepID=UPI001124FCF9|nr:hypothetical protein [Bacillus cereus]